MLTENLTRVRRRMEQACARCGRDPSSVTLIGVTKGVPPSRIREAVALGVTDLGENRVQEARDKQDALHDLNVRWHLIGHLQRNKAKDAVERFSVVQSVDSVALVEELQRQAEKRQRSVSVLVHVNVSGEATKFGCRPEEVQVIAQAIQNSSSLKLLGLMTIAPFSENPEDARPHFRRLRQLRDDIHLKFFNSSFFTHHSSLLLSMGMSGDFEVAIEEGADCVRVGTAIFGTRDVGHGGWESKND